MAAKRLVLYFPQMADPEQGSPLAKYILPLSLLSIAGIPVREGYEVVLIDGNLYSTAEAHARVVEACEGALLYATTGLIGHQVLDGLRCSQAVKARHPELPLVIGGWFASVMPELQLRTGLYEAVALGQGELTFAEIVSAVAAGEPLDGVAGLALLRDGELVRTAPRPVAGWDALPNCPWQLIDITPYRDAQLVGGAGRELERLPETPGQRGRPVFAISYFSSYGCPEPCTFCCSPDVTRRRWKAMPADRLLDDLGELQDRWGFSAVRFYDANWGVDERRARAFGEGLLERETRLWWYPMVQARSLLAYRPDTLDILRDSGLYIALLGGETGDPEMMRALGKHTHEGDNLAIAGELDRRGVRAWLTYMIGYPGESEESMMKTIDEARRIAASCRNSRPTVWPYHPLPGSALYPKAIEHGYRPPTTLEEWSGMGEYHLSSSWPGYIPPAVERAKKILDHYCTLSLGLARGRIGWWERRARRRLERGDWRGARVEAKAFDVCQKLVGRMSTRIGVVNE